MEKMEVIKHLHFFSPQKELVFWVMSVSWCKFLSHFLSFRVSSTESWSRLKKNTLVQSVEATEEVCFSLQLYY